MVQHMMSVQKHMQLDWEMKKMTMVRVHNGMYRNQPVVSGEFELLEDVKCGKSGRRRASGNDGHIWYITVKMPKDDPLFSGWGNKKDKVRIIVPGPNNGYEIVNN